MKKAFTVTIENGSRIGKAVFEAASFAEVRRQFALMQRNDANLKGFCIVKIQENEKPQRVGRFQRPVLKSAMGRALDAASNSKSLGSKRNPFRDPKQAAKIRREQNAILKKENKNK